MDLTTLIVIIVVVALLVFFMNRNRTIARGTERPTYDDPNYRSSGSIGGSQSGGSPSASTSHQKSDTGGASAQRPSHDDPDYRSGGSIGG